MGIFLIGISINLSAADLAAFTSPIGGVFIGLASKGLTHLLSAINPSLSFFGTLTIGYLAANVVAIQKA
jgi:hypothetical protein